jgi:anti-sigma regulatory factor (Ser/Thr protein kinase)
MSAQERRLALPAELASIRTGRFFARDVVLAWGLEALSDDVQLGVSELLTNAVKHAATDVVLTLCVDTELRVEVRDWLPELRRPLVPGPAAPDATTGRGLQIVAAISSDWGIAAFPQGKSVWFTLALPDTGTDEDADVFSLQNRRERHDQPDEPDEDSDEHGDEKLQARAAT